MKEQKSNNKKLKTKKEKGITLIALIITIVVLLILAVVTIGAIRESSIITHAQNAKESWKNGVTQEEINLKLAELKIDMIQNADSYKFNMQITENETVAYDNGEINKIFKNIGLTIDESQLTQDEKFILELDNPKLFANCGHDFIDGDLYMYWAKCKDENEKELIALVGILPDWNDDGEAENETYIVPSSIEEIYLYGDFGNKIYNINNDILDNPDKYKVSGTNTEAAEQIFQILYDTLIENDLKIESEELLNSEKNGFNMEAFFNEENPKIENASFSRGIVVTEMECSYNGERSILKVLLRIDDGETKILTIRLKEVNDVLKQYD